MKSTVRMLTILSVRTISGSVLYLACNAHDCCDGFPIQALLNTFHIVDEELKGVDFFVEGQEGAISGKEIHKKYEPHT